jgi:hypothetical protein
VDLEEGAHNFRTPAGSDACRYVGAVAAFDLSHRIYSGTFLLVHDGIGVYA